MMYKKINCQYFPHFLNIFIPAVECPALPAPANGSIRPPPPYMYKSRVWMSCHAGYIYNGPQVLACGNHNKWNGSVGTCRGKYIYTVLLYICQRITQSWDACRKEIDKKESKPFQDMSNPYWNQCFYSQHSRNPNQNISNTQMNTNNG